MERETLKFYLTRPSLYFSGIEIDYSKAKYVIIGVPFDSTSSFRPGSRFAPTSIRNISLEMESYDVETGIDFDSLLVHDAGDLSFVIDPKELTKKLSAVIKEIIKNEKIPVIIGGEHTLTYGSILGTSEIKDVTLVFMDAHLDLRDQYPIGANLTHATVLRRCVEKIGCNKIVVIGARAVSPEEVSYARECGLMVVYSHEIRKKIKQLLNKLNGEKVYLSIDIDVIDPGLAPGVSNPEPLGLSLRTILKILKNIILKNKLLGADIVEVNPLYDRANITSTYATLLIKKIILYNEIKNGF